MANNITANEVEERLKDWDERLQRIWEPLISKILDRMLELARGKKA